MRDKDMRHRFAWNAGQNGVYVVLIVWAVLEWECCIKSQEQGAREGSKFISDHIIEVSEKSFDDFASGTNDQNHINDILGL